MKITKVNVRLYEKSSLKGFADVTLDDCLVLTGIKIVDGKKGHFISMPSEAGADDKYYDIYFPITKDFREELEDAVLDEYEAVLKEEAGRKAESGSLRRRK